MRTWGQNPQTTFRNLRVPRDEALPILARSEADLMASFRTEPLVNSKYSSVLNCKAF
jgi:hypothetical protein